MPNASLPKVSLLLIAYNQQSTIAAAVQSALAQTYASLEILISDDASQDGTFGVMQALVDGYCGDHAVRLFRNHTNLGIGAHISQLAQQASGELLVIAAGDDIALPERCERMAQAWIDSGRQLDLIACSLANLDADGEKTSGKITPSQLADYRTVQDWMRQPPYVIGAGQAWTKRLFDRFGPLASGVIAEDLVMVFRAICSGGAKTVDEILVHYRQGGISRKRRAYTVDSVTGAWLKNSKHTLVEYHQLLQDAHTAGCASQLDEWLAPRVQHEETITKLFSPDSTQKNITTLLMANRIPWQRRLRLAIYAFAPSILRPLFLLKRVLARTSTL